MSDEPFDPRNIRPRIKQEDKPDLEPLKQRAAQPDSRSPFLTSIKEALKNTERGKTKAAEATTKRVRAEADRNIALKQIDIDTKQSEAKLKAAELALEEQSAKVQAVVDDRQAEIDFLKEKRALERQAELARIKNKQRVDDYNADQTVNPPEVPRERTKQEIEDERFEKSKLVGLDIIGEHTEKVADQILIEFANNKVDTLEALGEINQDLEHLLRRRYHIAYDKDSVPRG